MRPEFGMGLQGVIAARAGVVSGILNGVDTGVWSPEAEPVPYSVTAMKGKAANRAEICAEFGLDVPGPLAILVSRLTDQKGIDLLAGTIPDFIAGGGGLIVLGSGDPALEGAVLGLQARHGGRVAVRIGYDEVPVVSAVGGLADTVIHASPAALAAKVATGIVFHPVDGVALGQALRGLLALYADRATWAQVQKNAMRQAVGWEASAAAYAALYEGIAR